jgi:hypothetical protein
MSWSYLGGLKWAAVTRDERFFCQRLFTLADRDPQKFVGILNDCSSGLGLPTGCEWEVGFEVCFFRDMRHHRGAAWDSNHFYSPKRTFDLCLFSDKHIVVIEAKAQQSFESDIPQLDGFADEVKSIQGIVGSDVEVSILTLASSLYLTEKVKGSLKSKLGTEPVTWKALSQAYNDDLVLLRADEVFEPASSGVNNQAFKTGQELIEAWKMGMKLFVGRSGGINGSALGEDIASGQWVTRAYETAANVSAPPNSNWFPLEQFAERVGIERASGPDAGS